MREDKIIKGLFIFLLAALVLPMLQQRLHVVNISILKGSYALAPNAEFSKAKWFDGSFQQEKAKYINDNLGFHEYLVRLNNQLDFSLFKIAHGDVIVGKENYLYQGDYIRDYYGQHLTDTNHAKEILIKLKLLQDTLHRINKTLVLVHAPSKAAYFPEYLPPKPSAKIGAPYHDLYIHLGDSLGINQIDFNSWFLSIKAKHSNLLISRKGIHWTAYGAFFAADSLVKYIERVRHISMPHPVAANITYVDTARGTDDDLEQMINLFFPVAHDVYAYPNIVYVDDSAKTKPKTIYIGDSFVWTLITVGLMKNANTDWKFWGRFHEEINQKTMDETAWGIPMDQIDWKTSLLNADCIILVYASHNLKDFGDGFIDKAYDHFYP